MRIVKDGVEGMVSKLKTIDGAFVLVKRFGNGGIQYGWKDDVEYFRLSDSIGESARSKKMENNR
ncbi:uridylate kinase [Gossypium australe]|uniref:Uridylate kinase n=1 Tax=Gossypium australe TaxID=47621 RepID=A0A5B6VSQ1_9ROSI|nr:uridylate kinase [Gossypium australe]